MQLKYKDEHKDCACICPPVSCSDNPPVSSGFRFVSNNPVNPYDDFLPVAREKPSRGFKGSAQNCQAYALSYFHDLQAAKKKWTALAKNSPAVFQRKNQICQTVFSIGDGLFCPIASSGHFSIHEARNIDLAAKSKVVEVISK